MQPELHSRFASERLKDDHHGLQPEDDGTATLAPESITIRPLREDDVAAVALLAELDGRAVPPGGFLIYTNQPWHPQLEMIARVLVHGDGTPWVMRCRPQREMDDLVRFVGFEKIDMVTDLDGIFTVSLAERVKT